MEVFVHSYDYASTLSSSLGVSSKPEVEDSIYVLQDVVQVDKVEEGRRAEVRYKEGEVEEVEPKTISLEQSLEGTRGVNLLV